MITLSQPQRVDARAAGETERVFHEIKQVLRVTGVPLPFRLLAAQPRLLAALWDGMRAKAETRAFEEASDRLREEAVNAADGMERLSVLGRAQLGESQAFQAESALMLYHYLDAKLLLLATALACALEENARPAAARPGSSDLIERGAPARMAPMELCPERSEEPSVRRAFADIKRALCVETPPWEFRVLGLWPRYLCLGWQRLKPIVNSDGFQTTCRRLRELSRELARSLPHAPGVSAEALRRRGEDGDEALALMRRLETELPGLVLSAALLALDWQAPELARRSPFPALARAGAGEC